MSLEYKMFDLGLVFRSPNIEAAILKLWQEFYQRLPKFPVTFDRAIWIFSRFPASVVVKPGFLDEDDQELFILGADIAGFEEETDAIIEKHADHNLNSPAYKKHAAEYERWLRDAVKATFQSQKVEKLRKAYGKKDLAVYWTAAPDIHSSELHEMTWLAGSKLK